MASLTISGVEKAFGKRKVLDGIDLTVQDGEFCVLVGPSGSGKSTLLRMIAGLEAVRAGSIALDGEVVNDLQPRDRNVALVPQSVTLFPYLNVRDNIAFGLRSRGVSRAEVAQRVTQAAELTGIADLLARYPRHLSEAESQCVAIAHAIARDALMLLLDEPLLPLDSTRRDDMRAVLKRLHRERQMTVIYVTRDQMEAMSLGERVVLMRDGRVEQDGAPIELFERPVSRFVAGFFGPLKMNLLAGEVVRDDARDAVRLADGGISVPLPPNLLPQDVASGAKVTLGLRPEHMMRAIRVSPPDGTLRYEAEIELLQPMGSRVCVTFRMGGEPVVAELQAHDVSAPGEKVSIDINLKRAALFDTESGMALKRNGSNGAPTPSAPSVDGPPAGSVEDSTG